MAMRSAAGFDLERKIAVDHPELAGHRNAVV
jgi:hypothetical protein